MTHTPAPPTSEQILKAVESVKQERPVYSKLLDFYGPLFVSQEASAKRVKIDPIHISDDLLVAKADARLPLITLTEFEVDIREAQSVLGDICDIAISARSDFENAAKNLKARLTSGDIDISTLTDALLGESDEMLKKVAAGIGVDSNVLSFLIYSSIKPSLTVCAASLSDHLKNQPDWHEGYCPICGSQPILFVLPDEGRRRLVCGFCWHQWEVSRIGCPFCGNIDSESLTYFIPDSEPAYRVNLCESCKKYIKGIDLREASHFVYLPLEQISSLHLDMKAVEGGYQSGLPMALPD